MGIRDIMANARGGVRNSYDSGVSNMLDRFGLEQQRSTMEIVVPAVAVFGAGLAIGAALGAMFAPKRGDELRQDIGHRLGDMRDRSVERYHSLVDRAAAAGDDDEQRRFVG